MKIARFEKNGRIGWGVVLDGEIADLSGSSPPLADNVVGFLAGEAEARAAAEALLGSCPRVNIQEVRLLSPVPRPGKMLGIGLNYSDHAAETGREPPRNQLWFNKQSTSINDPFGDVTLPLVSKHLDYEAELVVVIGKHGRHVPRERASEIIGGYMCGSDFSVRDWQKASPTMMMGKGFDSHAPVGPWVTTPDEVGSLSELRVKCLVNGKLRQNGCAGDMIFGVPEQIEHLSKAFTLEPGDLIFTGTPAGVGVAYDPPKYLRKGDVVRVEIDGLGAIENRIVAENHEIRIG